MIPARQDGRVSRHTIFAEIGTQTDRRTDTQRLLLYRCTRSFIFDIQIMIINNIPNIEHKLTVSTKFGLICKDKKSVHEKMPEFAVYQLQKVIWGQQTGYFKIFSKMQLTFKF